MTTENEQIVLDAFERGKAFGFAEGLRQQAEEIELLQNDIVKQQEFVCQQQAEIEALKLYKEKIETMERTYDNHFAQAMGNPKIKKASEK